MSVPDLRSAASLLEKGDYESARLVLEWLVTHDEQYVAAHILLAKIAENQSRYKDALKNWEAAWAANPMSSEVSISYQAAVMRLVLPGPTVSSRGNLHLVPPLEQVDEETDDEPVARAAAIPVPIRETAPAAAAAAEVSEPVDETVALDGIEDLDRLIDELETARIVPDPEIDDIDEADLTTDIEDVVSETLARIYASQNCFMEAGEVYEKLALQHPERSDEFRGKAADMLSRATARN